MTKEQDNLQLAVSKAQRAKEEENNQLLEQYMTEIYKILHPIIINTITYAVKTPPLEPYEVEDTASEVWINIQSNLTNYDPKQASMKTWTQKIATNKAIDMARRRNGSIKRTISLDREDGETGNEYQEGSMYSAVADTKNTDPAQQYLEELHQNQERQAAIRVLHRMRSQQERLLDDWLDYIDSQTESKLTHEDIAKRLRDAGNTDATWKMVESRFRRLREKFTRLLEEELGEDIYIS